MSMVDFWVGRTKRSAAPAIARHMPERRCAWSGLQTLRSTAKYTIAHAIATVRYAPLHAPYA